MNKYLADEINELSRLSTQKVMISIFDTSGTLLAISNYSAQLLGVPSELIVGMNLLNLTTEQIKLLMPDITKNEIITVQEGYNTLRRLLEILIEEKIPLSYINFMPYGHTRKPFLETALPIFGDNLDVIGVKVITTEYSLYGQNEYFSELCKISSEQAKSISQNSTPLQKTKINLADRQYEIVYLLANGFTQSEVAQILNISRGSVANIVSEQICPKFKIAGSSTKLLIDKAITLGLNKTMPSSLYKPFIIVLNNEITERYF
ncbi:MAG: hypothetical protein EKK54_04565 [Neisseriaceae bacterium]|nr:MAG: hypothetical protein EKK54_04565 [Neisseriaceae bacterium]